MSTRCSAVGAGWPFLSGTLVTRSPSTTAKTSGRRCAAIEAGSPTRSSSWATVTRRSPRPVDACGRRRRQGRPRPPRQTPGGTPLARALVPAWLPRTGPAVVVHLAGPGLHRIGAFRQLVAVLAAGPPVDLPGRLVDALLDLPAPALHGLLGLVHQAHVVPPALSAPLRLPPIPAMHPPGRHRRRRAGPVRPLARPRRTAARSTPRHAAQRRR